MLRQLEGFPSGQREQTVNLPRKLRRFESFPLHQILPCSLSENGARVGRRA